SAARGFVALIDNGQTSNDVAREQRRTLRRGGRSYTGWPHDRAALRTRARRTRRHDLRRDGCTDRALLRLWAEPVRQRAIDRRDRLHDAAAAGKTRVYA